MPSSLPSRKLVVITPHWEGIRVEFARAFSEWTARNLGHRTEIEWLDVGGTSDAIRYVRSEFKRAPDGINIDLFFGGGLDPYLQFKKEGLLAPCRLPPGVIGRIPPTFSGIEVYDPEYRWFGACLSGFGIVYNKKVLSILQLPEPTSWEDLARPEFFSWVESGEPRSSGSMHMAYEIILQAYGWEKGWSVIKRLSANVRNFSRSGSEAPQNAALGEVACGLAIDVYAWRQVSEAGTNRMGFCLPEGLTVINPDGIAVLKGAPNADLAEKLVEFVLGEFGQKLWTLKIGASGGPKEFELDRMSVIPGFAAGFGTNAAVEYDAYKWKSGFEYDAEKGSTRWAIVNDLIGAVAIDTHSELAAAWRKVMHLPPDDPRVAELLAAPLPEEEIMRMARGEWNDATLRTRVKSQWTREAKERYLRIAGGGNG